MCKRSNALSKPALIGRAASLTLTFMLCERRVVMYWLRFRDLVCELELVIFRSALTLCVLVKVGNRTKSFPGGDGGGVPPVPISNTEVKPSSADGTALETRWESRKLPGFNLKASVNPGAFSCFREFPTIIRLLSLRWEELTAFVTLRFRKLSGFNLKARF